MMDCQEIDKEREQIIMLNIAKGKRENVREKRRGGGGGGVPLKVREKE